MIFDLTTAQLFGFLFAAVLVTLAPGPDNLAVLSLGISRGRRAGIGFGLGCALGCFTHTLWASLGISAVLAASNTAFTLFKLAGAAYLVWLGWQALKSPGAKFAAGVRSADATSFSTYLRRGFIANAINPKVALFFLAFLPQFVPAGSAHAAAQSAVLGGLFAAQTVVVFGLIGWFAGTIGGFLMQKSRRLDQATGVLFIGLGVRLALETKG
ncbi:LysE family translocator [Sulfuricystis multivorans]|uniref:LysE family translocator n=1 Tax=Sulfuricystis multivorans TaxID=2211108 RepID=UPI000F835B32|nr:LysE family translocator [Sulfuricystis multivorans]